MAPCLSERKLTLLGHAISVHPQPITKSDIRFLADNYMTSERAVYRLKSKIEEGGPLYPRRSGPTRIITWKHEQAIRMLQ